MIALRPESPTANAYRSYLVRFWRSHEQSCWRASAQCVQSGNTVLFGNVTDLLAFLHHAVDDESGSVELGCSAETAG